MAAGHIFQNNRPTYFFQDGRQTYVTISTSVKTIRPLSLPVPIPAQRARKPSQMQQKNQQLPPASPCGPHRRPPWRRPRSSSSRSRTLAEYKQVFCAAVIRLFLPNFAAIRWDLPLFLDI